VAENHTQEVPDFCQKPTLILGCGNLLFGDDGFGCAVIQSLEKSGSVPEEACIADAGTGVRKLLFTLCLSPIRPERLLIVDAFDTGRQPGELFEINPAEIPAIKCDDFSMHQVPTSNLLRELQEECGVKVRVLACQTGPLPEQISVGLSNPVERAVGLAARWILEEYLKSMSWREPRASAEKNTPLHVGGLATLVSG